MNGGMELGFGLTKSKIRQKMKRMDRMQKAYGPDCKSIDFMAAESLYPIHRITKLSPKMRPVTAAVRRGNGSLNRSPNINLKSAADLNVDVQWNNNNEPNNFNLIPMGDGLQVNNLVQN